MKKGWSCGISERTSRKNLNLWFKQFYVEDENNDVTELMRPRYSKDVPLKGIGQLTGAVRKWSEDYLQQSGFKSLIFYKFYI